MDLKPLSPVQQRIYRVASRLLRELSPKGFASFMEARRHRFGDPSRGVLLMSPRQWHTRWLSERGEFRNYIRTLSESALVPTVFTGKSNLTRNITQRTCNGLPVYILCSSSLRPRNSGHVAEVRPKACIVGCLRPRNKPARHLKQHAEQACGIRWIDVLEIITDCSIAAFASRRRTGQCMDHNFYTMNRLLCI